VDHVFEHGECGQLGGCHKTIPVFKRVETDTMSSRMLPIIGGLGVFHHDRELAPLTGNR